MKTCIVLNLVIVLSYSLFAMDFEEPPMNRRKSSAKGTQSQRSLQKSKRQKVHNKKVTRRQQQIARIKQGEVREFRKKLTKADANRSAAQYVAAAYYAGNETEITLLLAQKLGYEKFLALIMPATCIRAIDCAEGDTGRMEGWLSKASKKRIPYFVRATIAAQPENQLEVLGLLEERAGGFSQLLALCQSMQSQEPSALHAFAQRHNNQQDLDWLNDFQGSEHE